MVASSDRGFTASFLTNTTAQSHCAGRNAWTSTATSGLSEHTAGDDWRLPVRGLWHFLL